AYIAQAANPDLRVIISNTTEAGITYSPDDHPDDLPPQSFPGKLTAFLNARFKAFNGDATKGCIIIPCELIEENGSELRRIVLQLAEEWKLSAEFVDWVKTANYFTNTLVDRIITGYPRDNYQEFFNELGYEDKLLDTGEIFHFWVIEAPENIELEALAAELPFEKIGLNVVWTRDCTPYKARKVRILNGAHTMSILAAYLSGKNTVGEMMDCADYRKYLERGLFEEVIPGILKYLPWSDLQSFANSVFDRFSNPTIKHDLLAIALNSQSKYRARVLPSILDYVAEKKELPPLLTFSFAALVAFYRGEINDGNMTGKRNGENYPIKDDRAVLEFYAKAWADHADDLTKLTQTICANFDFWGQDLNKLPNFTKTVVQHIGNILTNGAQAALREVL
ncbi:MAG: tagaturonate reductase, partial [Defluviitaleaceae bacterium]|nr:tagaturonate reductase [Defluviitaleaceae bacterium]